MDNNSLAHTKWECKYHLVFAPKYRRQVIYKDIRADVGQILGTLCRRKGIEIIEAECMPDHVHMLVRIPPKYSVSEIVGYLKGKSSLMIFEKHANLKYKYGNRHFWCRCYYVDTVGKNTAAIKAYIQSEGIAQSSNLMILRHPHFHPRSRRKAAKISSPSQPSPGPLLSPQSSYRLLRRWRPLLRLLPAGSLPSLLFLQNPR